MNNLKGQSMTGVGSMLVAQPKGTTLTEDLEHLLKRLFDVRQRLEAGSVRLHGPSLNEIDPRAPQEQPQSQHSERRYLDLAQMTMTSIEAEISHIESRL